ncbi:HAD family phosphatase [Longispora sp. NPDC051575]|uniref:HAD family hydrolase n=1 Tax=Longispora sp. NPDC051575 TaxID=3154943 RepID=UPI0034243BEB
MRKGLLIDWGGVLTTDVFASFAAFCGREGLPADRVATLFRTDPAARDLLAGLESGTISTPEFETSFGVLLRVRPTGLLRRLTADIRPDPVMREAVLRARLGGVRTGLVSNSWGPGGYTDLADLFDGVVLSGTVGVRKPDPAIYALGAAAIGLTPGECVFVDDLGGNLKPARALGMATVRHTHATDTLRALDALLGLDLSGAAARIAPGAAGSDRVGLGGAAFDRAGGDGVGPVRAGLSGVGSDGAGGDGVGPVRAGLGGAGPDRAGTDDTGPDRANLDLPGPARSGLDLGDST